MDTPDGSLKHLAVEDPLTPAPTPFPMEVLPCSAQQECCWTLAAARSFYRPSMDPTAATSTPRTTILSVVWPEHGRSPHVTRLGSNSAPPSPRVQWEVLDLWSGSCSHAPAAGSAPRAGASLCGEVFLSPFFGRLSGVIRSRPAPLWACLCFQVLHRQYYPRRAGHATFPHTR